MQKLDPNGAVLKTWGTTGSGDGQLDYPYDIAVDPAGDAYTNGHSVGPVAYDAGGGLRFDVTWFGFVERTTLRIDVAKTLNVKSPAEIWFGANMPY